MINAFQELHNRVPLCERGIVSPRLFAAPSRNPGAMYFPVLFAAGCSALLLAVAPVPMVKMYEYKHESCHTADYKKMKVEGHLNPKLILYCLLHRQKGPLQLAITWSKTTILESKLHTGSLRKFKFSGFVLDVSVCISVPCDHLQLQRAHFSLSMKRIINYFLPLSPQNLTKQDHKRYDKSTKILVILASYCK